MSAPLILKSKAGTALLVLGLTVAVLAATLLIVKLGDKTGYLLMLGMIGAALGFCALLFPRFGFSLAVAVSFSVFDIGRLFQAELPLGTMVDALVFATFLGTVMQKLLRREAFWQYCSHPIVYLYLLYTAYTLMQVFNPNLISMSGTVLILRKYIVLMLFLYCAIQLFNTPADIRYFLRLWLGLGIAAALYGCYQQWFGMPRYELDYLYANPLLVSLYSLDTGGFRVFSFLSDPKDFGLIMAATSLLVLGLLLNERTRKAKTLARLVCLVVFLLAMSYSGTRTANFMFVMGLILYILMTINHRKTLVFAMSAAFVFVGILYGPIYGNPTINRIRSTFDVDKEESLQVRDINRKRIQPYIWSHPMGGGLGTTGVLNAAKNVAHPLAGFPSDSGLLLTALEVGWVGLLLQLVLYYTIISQGIKAYFRTQQRSHANLLLVATTCLFSYMAAQYAQVAIGQPPGVFLYYAFIALIVRLPGFAQVDQNPLV